MTERIQSDAAATSEGRAGSDREGATPDDGAADASDHRHDCMGDCGRPAAVSTPGGPMCRDCARNQQRQARVADDLLDAGVKYD